MHRLQFLGWACLLAVSTSIGYAMTVALADRPVAREDSAGTARQPAPGEGMRWILVLSRDGQGGARGFSCLTAGDRVAADVVEVAPEQFDRVISDLHCHN